MPITNETILQANQKMIGRTNRAVLFAKVNMDRILDPDMPEDEQEFTPSLAQMLAEINEVSDEEFLSSVRENLTVTSFKEFLDKFQPGFYYRVRPPKQTGSSGAAVDDDVIDASADDIGGDGEAGEDSGAGGNGAPAAEEESGLQLEFALEGGPGWKKVRITSEHPYIRSLTNLIKMRVRQDVSTFRVDVDASLLAFKPRSQRALMRKLAEDVQAKNSRMMLEAKRNPGSKDALRALDAYNSVAEEFQGALEDQVRVLPTVVYGLEQTARELRRLAPGGGPVDTNVYQIEFGKDRRLLATPQSLPSLGAAASQAALGGAEAKALAEGETGSDTDLARAEAKKEELAIKPIENALEKIRKESEKFAAMDLATIPKEKQFPIAVGKFMDKMIQLNRITPLFGNLVATVLQDPKELAILSPDPKDVDFYHDTFLRMYSFAIEDFLKTVTPLFETIMGVYLLFNEFPADVRLPEESKPQLILANADLPDLFLTRKDELKRFFEISCAQATNQFRDAISFVIVPNCAEFKKRRPTKKRKSSAIAINEDVAGQIKDAQAAGGEDSEGYGRVTFVDEMLEMMDWGREYFFQVLFSPEERVRAGRVQRDFFSNLADNYAIETVVDSESADCAIMCLPDFVIMPPDGKLITGKTSDGTLEVGAEVPELTVRSCFVATGRLMANDVPAYLRRKLQRARKDPTAMRMDIPGVAIDLSVHPYLGETEVPVDHFLGDGVLGNLLSDDMPFTVFTHVTGKTPFLSVPRTMKRIIRADGSSTYSHLHLFRQQAYLSRLLRAAHELGYAGALPEDNVEAEAFITGFIDHILKWTKWYAPEKLVNSFPSRLREDQQFEVHRGVGNSFNVSFNFVQGMIGELTVKF